MDYETAKPTESFPLKFLKNGDGDAGTISKGNTENESQTWGQVWFSYSQNTTLHGVNKITEETPFIVRRSVTIFD